MNFLGPLTSLMGMELDHVTDRIKHAVVINATLLVLGFAGLGFLVAAGFMALAEQVGSIFAALICAGGFLILALAVHLGAWIAQARRRRILAEKRRNSETSAFLTTATLTALPVLLRSPLILKLGLPAAAIATLLVIGNGADRDDPE